MKAKSPPVALGVLICALGAGCTFDGSGLAASPPPPSQDGSADILYLEARADTPLVDHQLHDLPHFDQPIEDAPLSPDSGPDSNGCLVEDFNSGPGQVQPRSGQWTVSGGAIRQSLTGAGNWAEIGGVTANDYVASALITVHSTFTKPGWVVGAALGVRLQPSADPTPRQYLCGVYPGSYGLVIVRCSGGDPINTCQVVRQTSPSISTGQQVLVRATIVGANLTCELPDLGGSTSYTTGGYTTGGPTLITQYADASYDDLSVCPAP